MGPRLVPEISSLDAFCDTAAAGAVGIGDSRSWITLDDILYLPDLARYVSQIKACIFL